MLLAKVNIEQLEKFLVEVDETFPTPLSKKQNLHSFAIKLHEKATLCAELLDGDIVSLAAGYTDNVVDGVGYISVVATVGSAQGRGFAKRCVGKFLDVARDKGLRAVHLYTARENACAIAMYQNLGFSVWNIENEPRPDDLHLIKELNP